MQSMNGLSRREFLQFAAGALMLSAACLAYGGDQMPASDLPRPTPAQQVWQDCEIGLLFCSITPLPPG